VYLQDWLSDPQAPMTWRLRKESAGSGALGDLGAHIVDAAQFVTGEVVTGVSALTNTFVKQRPSEDGGTDEVTVDDTALFLARLSGGAVASFEATRFALGRKNAMRLEVNGSKASLAFDFESMNELQWYEGTGTEAGFRRILVTEPEHPYVGVWWPPGHLLGYEHTFTNEVADLLDAIGAGADPEPSFEDGLRVQRVLQAVAESASAQAAWTAVEEAR
jgi:predicted dehydrogenase